MWTRLSLLDPTVQLFAGTLAVLLTASLVGALLKWRVAGRQPHPVIDNLNSRIKAWWVMVAVLGLAFVFGKPGALLLFAFMSWMALREFIALTPTRSADRLALGLMFGLVLPLQYFLIGIEWYGLYSILIPVYAFLVLPILACLRGDTTRFLERAALVQWGLMVSVYCVSHVPALLTLAIPGYEGRHLALVAYLIVVVQGSDVLQYVWGKLAGRRKIAPELSPSKTVEGFVGGVASATLLGAALYRVTPFTPWQSAGVALTLCLMGFLGGLVMSAIKRDRGVKDWGTLIEGHGGMLDRLDSVVFAAPVFFHVVRFWWTP
ncbi:phosphatidate cytidylyltransferase [Aquabacterium sp. A7-Y]|uniref:phosphatidate cytidylyltransferase n=1 Tax=Aquabacterium sp. A7-Y TaxID=1349605 RepID=UPI00223E892B|nr:phosphatidate cytidylyltransferase [Aquabacterium sp. A7-Y]MCW7537530.1 phosphatidate cytidylyltransferase [Aquabacterium sp. A7-Y]